MRRISVCIENGHSSQYETFEVEDNATDEEIEGEAKDIFLNYCNYGWRELEEGEEEE